jgi:hypothetical protein
LSRRQKSVSQSYGRYLEDEHHAQAVLDAKGSESTLTRGASISS